MNVVREVELAEARIRPHVRETILDHSSFYSTLGDADVYCKLECLQLTGSFKLRGAMNKVLSLSDAERARGVVTASTGNHGAAVALALGRSGANGVVFVPEGASPAKVANIERMGAEVRRHGSDSGETEAYARRYASGNRLVFVSPYNDPEVIGGQGTIALELLRPLERVVVVRVSVGGGGLISGIAGYLKSVSPHTQIIGASPENSPVMIESVRAGHIRDMPSKPTLSDGTAGGVEPDAITFELVRDHVDRLVTVTEEEIAAGMREFIEVQHCLLEGAAGVAVAAFRKCLASLRGKTVVIVICGGNISPDVLRSVL